MSLSWRLYQGCRPFKHVLLQQGPGQGAQQRGAHCGLAQVRQQRAEEDTQQDGHNRRGRQWQQEERWVEYPWVQGLHWGAILALGFQVFRCHQVVHRLHSDSWQADARARQTCPAVFVKRFLNPGAAGYTNQQSLLRALPRCYYTTDKELFVKKGEAENVGDHISVDFSQGQLEGLLEAWPAATLPTVPGRETSEEIEAQEAAHEGGRRADAARSSDDVSEIDGALSELSKTQDKMVAALEARLGLDLLQAGDQRSGISLLHRAARRHHPEALHNLGVAYFEGVGVAQDAKKAVRCFRRAADVGYVPSMYNLASIYQSGLEGSSPDLKRAEEFLRNAKVAEEDEGANAAQQHPEVIVSRPERDPATLYLLGRAHHFGLAGLAPDLEMALACYEMSAAEGHRDAVVARDRLRSSLHPELEVAARSPCLPHSRSVPAMSVVQTEEPARVRKRSRSLTRIDSFDSGLE